MVYTNFDFTPLLLPESRNTVKEKVPIIIRLPALYSVGVTGFEPATTRPPGAYFMIYVFCICLIFSMVFIDNQLFNFYKFSSVLMVFA
jgi:ABC-type multidrug transport system permease subunit